jgi:hypothetical protein
MALHFFIFSVKIETDFPSKGLTIWYKSTVLLILVLLEEDKDLQWDVLRFKDLCFHLQYKR